MKGTNVTSASLRVPSTEADSYGSAVPPRSTSPTCIHSFRNSPHLLARRTLPRYFVLPTSSSSSAVQQPQPQGITVVNEDEAWKKSTKPANNNGDNYILSPICPNLRGGSARTAAPAAKPSVPIFASAASPLNHNVSEYSFSPSATESPAMSVSIEDPQQKEGADEMMVWTNAAFQATSNLEERDGTSVKSTAAEATPTYPTSKPSSRSASPFRFMMLSPGADQHAPASQTCAAGEEQLEKIELEIKQLTERLKKLQVQKEQMEARRRRQRPRWGQTQQPAQEMISKLSDGVPTFKGLRASQPMKKKQYVPGSARVTSMIRAAAREEESRTRKRLQDSSSLKSGLMQTATTRSKQRVENAGARILHNYGNGAGTMMQNKGRAGAAVSLSCQSLNVAALSSRSIKFPSAAVPSSVAAATGSSHRRSSIVAKSLVSFLHGNSSADYRAQEQRSGDAGAQQNGLQVLGKRGDDMSMLNEVWAKKMAKTVGSGCRNDDHPCSAKPKSTAALYERLECLLRESQVFFEQKHEGQGQQQRRSRTAPSTPQAPKHKSAFPTLGGTSHHLLDECLPQQQQESENELIMRKLQAIAASHDHSHDQPSRCRNGSAPSQAPHFASPPRSRLLRSGKHY